NWFFGDLKNYTIVFSQNFFDNSVFRNFLLNFEIFQRRSLLFFRNGIVKKLFVSQKLRAKILIVQKSIFFITDAYKCRIKVRSQFFYFTDKQVAHHKISFVFLFVKFKKAAVFEQSYFRLRTFM